MTATLMITFDDGSSRQIAVGKAIEIDTASEFQELSFRSTRKGWVMAFTKPLFEGKKLADNFLSAAKQRP